MYAMHAEMCCIKFPGALLVGDKEYVGLIRLLSNMHLAPSSSLTCCATDYTVRNGSFALGGYGYATDGGNPSVKVCKFQIASCSSLQEGHGEQKGENPSGSGTQSHNNFRQLTSCFSHQLLCMCPGS